MIVMKIWMLIILCIALIILSSSSVGAGENDFCVRLTIGLVGWNPALVFSISPDSSVSLLSEIEIIITNAYGLSFQADRSDVKVVGQNYFKVRFNQNYHSVQFWATAEDLKPYLKKTFSLILIIKDGSGEHTYSVKVEDISTDIPFKGIILTTWGRVKT